MATSLICGCLTATLRTSGARNTFQSATKVSVCPRWSTNLRASLHFSVMTLHLSWQVQLTEKWKRSNLALAQHHWVRIVFANMLTSRELRVSAAAFSAAATTAITLTVPPGSFELVIQEFQVLWSVGSLYSCSKAQQTASAERCLSGSDVMSCLSWC